MPNAVMYNTRFCPCAIMTSEHKEKREKIRKQQRRGGKSEKEADKQIHTSNPISL